MAALMVYESSFVYIEKRQVHSNNGHIDERSSLGILDISVPVALFTKILTIKNCRKCKNKIKKSFTKILTIILSVKIVLTLRVKLPCPKQLVIIQWMDSCIPKEEERRSVKF